MQQLELVCWYDGSQIDEKTGKCGPGSGLVG